MFPQRAAGLRRSRRLSAQKQGTLDGICTHVTTIQGPVFMSPPMNFVPEQMDRVVDMVQNTKDHRKKKTSTTRPPNAFMLYRSDFWAREKLKVEPIERDHRDISRIAAMCWNSLDDETKAIYRKRADEHKELHRLQYPEYRYSPVLRGTTKIKRKRMRKSESADEERCKQLAVRVMTEFHKDDSQWPRKNIRRQRRDHKLIHSEKEFAKSVFDMETNPVTVQEDSPTVASLKEEDYHASIQADTSNSQFGQKLRVEKYIPDLRFWFTVEESQKAADRFVFDSRNDDERVPRDAASLGRVDQLPSLLAGEADPDCLDELDQYFQFDKYDEN